MHVGCLIHQTFGQQRVQAVFDIYIIRPLKVNVRTVLKSGSLNLLEPAGLVQACTGIALTFKHTSAVSHFKKIQVFLFHFHHALNL